MNNNEINANDIVYTEIEWGGCLRAIIDGKPQNIADHMNELEKKKKQLGVKNGQEDRSCEEF